MDSRRFDTFSDAFDYCREGSNRYPVTVWVKDSLYRLHPSGRAELLYAPPAASVIQLRPQEPPDDPMIYNRRQADGTFRSLAGFWERDDAPLAGELAEEGDR